MKKLLSGFIILYLTSGTFLMSQQIDPIDSQMKLLLEQVEAKIPSEWDYAGSIIEGGADGLKKIPEFALLQAQVNSTLPQVMDNLQEVAPTDTTKTILLEAYESSLTTDNYLQFLNQTEDLTEKNILTKQYLGWALDPADNNVEGILVYNYEKPIAKSILEKAKIIYASDPKLVKYYDAMLSGESRRGSEEVYKDESGMSRSRPALEYLARSKSGNNNQSSSNPSPTASTTPKSETMPQSVSETSIPFWIYGIILLSIGCIVGIGFFFLREKR